MPDQVLGGGDDFGDTSLVVGPEERRARRRDDVMADLFGESRDLTLPKHRIRRIREHDVRAVPLLVHDRLDACSGHFGRRVHVRNEADHRDVRLGRRRRYGGHDVTVFVDRRVVETNRAKLVDQAAQQRQLRRGARVACRTLVGLRVDLHVAEETVQNRHSAMLVEGCNDRRVVAGADLVLNRA